MERGTRPKVVGKVVKQSGDKTAKVAVKTLKRHPLYGKVFKVTKIYQIHDENNVAKVGDVVEVQSCRPISKTKSWRLVQVVSEK
jgi:small subunit ribosomal protein S17